MRRMFSAALAAAIALGSLVDPALAQDHFFYTPGNATVPGMVPMAPNSAGKAQPVNNGTVGAQIQGNASGSTSAVVGTLAAAAAVTTYICGFNVQAAGGTAAVGPITIAGLLGGSQTYQATANATGGQVAGQTFTPCLPASAVNTSITTATTPDGTATAVNVNSWGFQQ